MVQVLPENAIVGIYMDRHQVEMVLLYKIHQIHLSTFLLQVEWLVEVGYGLIWQHATDQCEKEETYF